ncbi:phosphoribosyltransferase [Thiomicrorhabdus heinhorstiae]|uniref:Phosphoribosyltransferase n=1 Tax=Thiomicrorhabdus heinhorstiae TaxID=2748010 RepID=A0ABS0BZG5_9GAMM|nr:phosphoribosyltransferase [Thiomicrorhabdus heinhorstiae]MBF6058854.1 phosphoribosyltransferase [Thiomicrorhabdus heinhorstiae]
MQLPIPDRNVAGRWLAKRLQQETDLKDPLVLALPRGGVPVAYEIAKVYKAPLDLLLVRKLGTPIFPELAMGAISSGGIRFLNDSVISAYNIGEKAIAQVETKERQELQRRETAYRGERPHPDLTNRDIILVDDGLATGSTMIAAIEAVKQQGPHSLTVAVPVSPPDTIAVIKQLVDHVVCPFQPYEFSSIGQWYIDFGQVSDEEVESLLKQAWQE